MLGKLPAIFFANESGLEPVRKWLKTLSKQDKSDIGKGIQKVQYGWPLGMPLVNNLDLNLWEIRINLQHGRIARVIFFMNNETIIWSMTL